MASKLTVRTLKETETIYDADGNVEKVKVKEKELDKDSLVAMMVAKAGNPELYNPTEWRRLQQEESSSNDLKAKIEELDDYKLSKYKTPKIEVPKGFE